MEGNINREKQEGAKKKYGKYLPIGTVVLLKDAKKRLMINGFCLTTTENGQKTMYDYCGVLYPEGVISAKQTFLFNHSQITKIFHLGLVNDDEERKFKADLKKRLMNVENA